MKILIERFKKSIPYILVILFISWAMYKYFLERNIKPKTSLALDWESLDKLEKLDKQTEKLPIEKKELIPVKEKEFTLNCIKLPDQSFLIKKGRHVSEKMPKATLSQIFDTSRKWAVHNV